MSNRVPARASPRQLTMVGGTTERFVDLEAKRLDLGLLLD